MPADTPSSKQKNETLTSLIKETHFSLKSSCFTVGTALTEQSANKKHGISIPIFPIIFFLANNDWGISIEFKWHQWGSLEEARSHSCLIECYQCLLYEYYLGFID